MSASTGGVTPDLREAFRLTRRRLVPFLLLMYVLSFLDRANVGFAKQAFQASTGVSDAAYALGASLFFVTYALVEVPSNLVMHKVGARIWMARIMVTWGLVSAATAFATGPVSFYVLRLLLGVAEAGFFPGVILFMTYWFPRGFRGQVLGLFYFGAPLAFIFGSPLSGLLLELHGAAGLQGWQWMFAVEGLLASIVGVWAFWYLDDKPADARWLPPAQKQALVEAVAHEEATKGAQGRTNLARLLRDVRVLHFTAVYFLIQMSVYGVVFYLPSQVAALLGKKVGLEVGLVTAVPWTCALLTAYVLPRVADRAGHHVAIAAGTLAISGLGIAVSAAGTPAVALLALCFAAAGFIAVQPLFWTVPTDYLGGAAAAGGIAIVNAIGALGGFVAPNVKAWVDASVGSSQAGLYALALSTLVGAALLLVLRRTDQAVAEPLPSPSKGPTTPLSIT